MKPTRPFARAVRTIVALGLLAGAGVFPSSGCGQEEQDRDPVPLTRLRTDLDYIRDEHGRYVFFHGVNVSGSTKAPDIDGNGVASYMQRPFPIDRARTEIKRLRNMGFNSMRLLLMWEAVEPNAKGQYDEAYLDYIRQIVSIANEYGVYVLLDMHQDMFSRFLYVNYNEAPPTQWGGQGTIQGAVLSLIPPYTDRVQGDGAPKWVMQACMPEKNFDSPNWGIPRIVSGLGNPEARADAAQVYANLTEDTGSGEMPEWITYFLDHTPTDFQPNESTDMLPFTNWGASAALSLDVERAYACLFAGDVAFPSLQAGGMNIKDYLQEAYANAWSEVTKRVADLPNVMGYDIINEPEGNFIMLTLAAAMIQANGPKVIRDALINQFKDANKPETGELIYNLVVALRLLPPSTDPATLELWGLGGLDLAGISGLNYAFDKRHLTPFYDRVSQAIQAVDPKAVVYLEPSSNATAILGGGLAGGMWDESMVRPPSATNVVFAPHNYADIYPMLGFNSVPRNFTPEEVRYRDYTSAITNSKNLATHSLGNTPVVFGEFGTYFNFGGIQQSIASNYVVSSQVLDNYYEAFDNMFLSRMVWCYSMHNTYDYGDLWNKEDFSVMDPQDQPRGEKAWSRPFVRALAGKPKSVHFYSDFHYFDPEKGQAAPMHEFEVRYGSKESEAPTEITVPKVQYPDGFYVWVSDGRCFFDPSTRILYHYPEADDPGVEHMVKMLPPLEGYPAEGWKYFFKDDKVVSR